MDYITLHVRLDIEKSVVEKLGEAQKLLKTASELEKIKNEILKSPILEPMDQDKIREHIMATQSIINKAVLSVFKETRTILTSEVVEKVVEEAMKKLLNLAGLKNYEEQDKAELENSMHKDDGTTTGENR